MSNIYFPDEEITFNDVYFVCYMIERVARRLKQRNRYVVEHIDDEQMARQLSIAATNHCLNPDQVAEEWIREFHLVSGDSDITLVNPDFTDKVPSETQMGKVYARLIISVNTDGNLVTTIRKVYASPICDAIDNYNSSAYYEPSYVQTRAYINGAF